MVRGWRRDCEDRGRWGWGKVGTRENAADEVAQAVGDGPRSYPDEDFDRMTPD